MRFSPVERDVARISYDRATGGESTRHVDYGALTIDESAVWIAEEDGGCGSFRSEK